MEAALLPPQEVVAERLPSQAVVAAVEVLLPLLEVVAEVMLPPLLEVAAEVVLLPQLEVVAVLPPRLEAAARTRPPEAAVAEEEEVVVAEAVRQLRFVRADRPWRTRRRGRSERPLARAAS